jgi:hypothetical protein
MPLSRYDTFAAAPPEIRRSPIEQSAEAGPSGVPRSAPAYYFLLIIGLLVFARVIYETGKPAGKPAPD